MKRLNYLFFILLVLIISSCNCRSNEVGSQTNPLIIEILTPKKTSEAVVYVNNIAKFVERESGLKTAIYVPTKSIDYIQALSLSNRKVDLAILNDVGYLFAKDEYGSSAELIVVRESGGEKRTSYCSAIISTELRSLEDLNGKSIAFTDEYSTAGYLIPLYILKQKGINVSQKVFAGSYIEAIRSLLLGKTDAASIYTSCDEMNNQLDGRSLVVGEFPDVFTKTHIIYKSFPLPNEPVVFRKGIPEPIKEKAISALMKCPFDQECRDSLKSLNQVTGFERTRGDEYRALKDIIRSLEKDTADLIPGGWILRIKNTPELPRTGN